MNLVTEISSGRARYLETRKVTLIGSVLDLALGVAKIIVGFLAYSQSLIADGVHSLSDLVTDVLVIWAAKEASREPDADHPYGHQRIETVASITLGLLLIGVAVAIGVKAVYDVVTREILHRPTFWALVVAAVSVASKEAIYQYTARAAERLQSDLLRSNAWHSRSDALSSVVVIIGVGGSMLGLTYLDAVAAIVVALMIVYVGWDMVLRGTRELIDTGVDAERLSEIRTAARQVEGVLDIHDLRTRRMGADVYLDGHVRVESRLSVSEGHRIGEAVYVGLREQFKDLADITIHVDPEDDEAFHRSAHLPLRSELTSRLRRYWRDVPESSGITNIVLHYLNGRLEVEVWLPLALCETLEHSLEIRNKLVAACADDPDIGAVVVLFKG